MNDRTMKGRHRTERFNWETICKIRNEYKVTKDASILAREYNVHPRTIYKIVTWKSYKTKYVAKGESMPEKIKIVGYVTSAEKETIHNRAKSLGMSLGAYLYELSMWDNRHDLVPQLRKGGSIICNGRKQN